MGRGSALISGAAALVLAGAAVAAQIPAEQAAQSGPPLRIGTVNDFRVVAGGYDTQRPLGRAIARFGEPTTRNRPGEVCDVRWRALASRWSFYNLGGPTPARTAGVASAPRRWRAAAGRPRAGFGSVTAPRRSGATIPGARSGGRSGRWWLVPVYSIAGGTYSSRLTVRFVRGRVAAFELVISAGGE